MRCSSLPSMYPSTTTSGNKEVDRSPCESMSVQANHRNGRKSNAVMENGERIGQNEYDIGADRLSGPSFWTNWKMNAGLRPGEDISTPVEEREKDNLKVGVNGCSSAYCCYKKQHEGGSHQYFGILLVPLLRLFAAFPLVGKSTGWKSQSAHKLWKVEFKIWWPNTGRTVHFNYMMIYITIYKGRAKVTK